MNKRRNEREIEALLSYMERELLEASDEEIQELWSEQTRWTRSDLEEMQNLDGVRQRLQARRAMQQAQEERSQAVDETQRRESIEQLSMTDVMANIAELIQQLGPSVAHRGRSDEEMSDQELRDLLHQLQQLRDRGDKSDSH